MHQWNTYLSYLQREVDAAIVAHYDATIKVQKAREKLREAMEARKEDEVMVELELQQLRDKWAALELQQRLSAVFIRAKP